MIESFDNSDPDNITATLRPYASISDIKDVFIMVPNTEEDMKTTDPSASETTPAPAETKPVDSETTPPSDNGGETTGGDAPND